MNWVLKLLAETTALIFGQAVQREGNSLGLRDGGICNLSLLSVLQRVSEPSRSQEEPDNPKAAMHEYMDVVRLLINTWKAL